MQFGQWAGKESILPKVTGATLPNVQPTRVILCSRPQAGGK